MTDADNDMFAGMIKEALNAREVQEAPIAREVSRELKAERCPCGSRQYPYNLFDHTGRLLLLCCHVCEKERRKQLNDDGETLTSDG